MQRTGFYAHAYRVLEDEMKSGNLPYRPLQSERKGKGRSGSQYAELLEKEDLYMKNLAGILAFLVSRLPLSNQLC